MGRTGAHFMLPAEFLDPKSGTKLVLPRHEVGRRKRGKFGLREGMEKARKTMRAKGSKPGPRHGSPPHAAELADRVTRADVRKLRRLGCIWGKWWKLDEHGAPLSRLMHPNRRPQSEGGRQREEHLPANLALLEALMKGVVCAVDKGQSYPDIGRTLGAPFKWRIRKDGHGRGDCRMARAIYKLAVADQFWESGVAEAMGHRLGVGSATVRWWLFRAVNGPGRGAVKLTTNGMVDLARVEQFLISRGVGTEHTRGLTRYRAMLRQAATA